MIPTFDSESFELELNGIPGGTSGSSFVQNPLVFLEIRFRPIYTMSGGDVGLICIQSDIKEAHRIHVS